MGEHHMTRRERDAFTVRWLLGLTTAQTDGNHRTARIIVDALAKAHGVPTAAARDGAALVKVSVRRTRKM
jgi:hypothetical protein